MCKIPNLFVVMKENNITQKMLSEAIGVTQGNISDWKSGRSAPTIDALLKISKYLNVSIDYLVGNEIENKIKNEVENENNISFDNEKGYYETYCSFETFLSLFEYNGKFYKNLEDFAFRGVSQSSYDLLPSFLREKYSNIDKEKLQDYILKDYKISKTYEKTQTVIEFLLLKEFYEISNKSGLKVPYVKQFENNYISTMSVDECYKLFFNEENRFWIGDDYKELVALAQHYGLQTRMLDWSSDYMTALYFASSQYVRDEIKENPEYKDKNISIWAVNVKKASKIKDFPLKFTSPSYYRNRNLNAQKGVLSYWKYEVVSEFIAHNPDITNDYKLVDNIPFNDKILEYYNETKDNECLDILYKFNIPASDSKYILEYLHKHNHSAADIFPGYEGVVKAIEEKAMMYYLKNKNNIKVSYSQVVPAAARGSVPSSKPKINEYDDNAEMKEE